MHNNKSQETRDKKNFSWRNHKGENPATSSKIEWAPIVVVKPKNIKMIPKNIKMICTTSLCVSLTWENYFSLTHAPQWVSVCVINREAHSLFILFRSLFIFFHSLETHSNILASLNNYLIEPTSRGVSNNPSAPQLVGTFPPPTKKEGYP